MLPCCLSGYHRLPAVLPGPSVPPQTLLGAHSPQSCTLPRVAPSTPYSPLPPTVPKAVPSRWAWCLVQTYGAMERNQGTDELSLEVRPGESLPIFLIDPKRVLIHILAQPSERWKPGRKGKNLEGKIQMQLFPFPFLPHHPLPLHWACLI